MGASHRPDVRRPERESPELWRRCPVERWLGTGVGALLGGLLSLAIPLWLELGFWLELGAVAVALPVVVCAVAGYLYGDRAIHGIARIFRALERMEYSVLVLVAWLLSGAVTALIGAVAITHVRRTWQLIRADEHESAQERILDGIDELHVRLYGIQERLTELDERLGSLERRLPEEVFLARLAGPVAAVGQDVAGGGSEEAELDG